MSSWISSPIRNKKIATAVPSRVRVVLMPSASCIVRDMSRGSPEAFIVSRMRNRCLTLTPASRNIQREYLIIK